MDDIRGGGEGMDKNMRHSVYDILQKMIQFSPWAKMLHKKNILSKYLSHYMLKSDSSQKVIQLSFFVFFVVK